MINICNDCRHSKVCIYKQKYNEKYTTLKNELKQDEPFFIELNCKEYESNIITGTLRKDFEVGITPLKQLVSNSCEGCSIYEDVKKGTRIIGDTCNFCSRSPFQQINYKDW